MRSQEGSGSPGTFLPARIDDPRFGYEHPSPTADPAAFSDGVAVRHRLGEMQVESGCKKEAVADQPIGGVKCSVIQHLEIERAVRLAEPIDYKAIDGQPVDLVFLLLSPPEAGAEHLKALAAVSRVVRHGPTLEKLRGARSRDAFAAVLMGADERDAA